MTVHQVELVASAVAPSEELVLAVGDYLDAVPGLVDPIVSADLRAGTLEVSVEVHAANARAANELAARAFRAALSG